MDMKLSKIAWAIASLALACSSAVAKDCYTYDYWGERQESPDAYRLTGVLRQAELGLDAPLNNPQGLFALGRSVFVCDTGNNRVIELFRSETDGGFSVVRVISSFRGDPSGKNSFAAPSDVFVTNSGELFVCDTDNGRVVKLDRDLNFLMEFTKPNDATYTQSLVFMPVKVVADSVGRAYVLAKNVNKGLLKYENDGKFAGFYGAGEVTYRWSDYVWKTLSTKAQRAQLESFVPTEYDNVALDRDGFMYAVTSTFEEWSLMQDRAKPIRRLNALGKDILVKNGEYPPIGDLVWGVAAGTSGPSRFNDITVLDNDVYVASDQTRGRLFAYDNQGNLLFAFSGKGNVEGYFKKPSALEHVGRDLLVLDAQDCSLTVFTPTEYGKLVFGALDTPPPSFGPTRSG